MVFYGAICIMEPGRILTFFLFLLMFLFRFETFVPIYFRWRGWYEHDYHTEQGFSFLSI
jgi:hypothetical protein